MLKGNVYWITGLSGAGKTTIGGLLYAFLKEKKDNVVLLDGDELRTVFKAYDYSYDGRKQLALKYSALCAMLSKQGIDVVICTVSMFKDVRKWNAENIDNYREIYLKVDIDTLIERDQKGLYSSALKGGGKNVMGIDLKFEEPENSDLVLDNSGKICPKEQLNKIIGFYDL